MSLITKYVNEISDCFAPAAIAGGIGYLLGHVVKGISPEAGLICSLIAGLATSIFWQPGLNISSFSIGVAVVLVLPYHACKYFRYAIPYPISLVIVGVAVAISLLAAFILHRAKKLSFNKTSD